MSFLTDAWENQKQEYARRYYFFMKEIREKGLKRDCDTYGHAMECSYVLISIFGCTSKEVEIIERFGFIPDDIEKELSANVRDIINRNM